MLNRREALAALGTVSLGALLGCGGSDSPTRAPTATPGTEAELDREKSCALTAEQTEGPYYFDVDAVRSDIRENRPGTPLALVLRVRDADCKPRENAIVDIWHCDAGGVYSGFEAGRGERFLRGVQATDDRGIARFTTIYPGFYQGRTVHIHAKVHLDRSTVLTTQLYFDDAVSDEVFRAAAYAGGDERQRNDGDGIFDASLVLALERSRDGYRGLKTFDVRA